MNTLEKAIEDGNLTEEERYNLRATVAGVGMSGCHVTEPRGRGFAQSVRVPIGISQSVLRGRKTGGLCD